MQSTEQTANSNPVSIAKAGLFALLGNPLRAKGTGAPTAGLIAVLALALVGLFAFAAAPVFAATPTFTVDPTPTVGYTTAQVSGTVNPESNEVYYWFDYAKDPAVEGWTPGPEVFTRTLASGSGSSPVSETLTGLAPGTEYKVRLHAFATSFDGEEWFSPEPYVAFTTKPVAKPTVAISTVSTFTSTTADFSGTVDPNAPGGAPGQDPAFNTPWHFQCTPECPGLTGGEIEGDNTAHEVTAEATGLRPNVDYKVELVASNAGGQTVAGPQTLHTPTIKPTITESSVKSSGETTTTANIEAKVNPGGETTSYVIEYGPSTSYGLTATGSIPAASAEVPFERELTELNANEEYHWRLTLTNAAGTATTLDHTFVYSTEAGGLPDGRQYELVTPPEKNGADIGLAFGGAFPPQVADDGARMLAPSLQCFAGSGSCDPENGGREDVPFEFARTSSGWVAHSLAPPAAAGLGYGVSEPNVFSSDTGTALFQIPPSVGAEANREYDFYGEQEHNFADIGPIRDDKPPYSGGGVSLELATADLRHLVYETSRPLWSFDPTISQGRSVYEYEGTGMPHPRLVGIVPGSSSELASECGTQLGGGANEEWVYNALSEDGETVYFTAVPCNEEQEQHGDSSKVKTFTLYTRYEHARSELISGHAGEHPVAGEACDAACQAQPYSFAHFEGASGDGSRVFFTDPHQLTDAASEDTTVPTKEGEAPQGAAYCVEGQAPGASGCNLYLSECPDRCVNSSERRLVDVSAGDKSGEGPRVLATVAISSDGSHVYFVARGALTGANRAGHAPVSGEPNLYVYDTETARTSFVAMLSSADKALWKGKTQGIGEANVTPDGRFLVFLSHAALTPDDTRMGAGAPPQVYRYDAVSETLVRVSAGAQGFRDDGNEGVVGPTFDTTRIAPAYDGFVGGINPLRTDPTMSNNGSFVFFESPIGLTPHALNDAVNGANEDGEPTYAENVYEWEQPGVASCPAAQAAGCTFLISDGKDVAENNQVGSQSGKSVSLLGSDGSGANVFFTTSDQLVAQDTDTERDIYDAHICSSEFYEERGLETQQCPAEAQATPPCLGEVCHGIPAEQQGAPTGGSLTLNGLGNITPAVPVKKVTKKTVKCKKNFVKNKKNKCVKQPKKKKAKAKRVTNDRRATR